MVRLVIWDAIAPNYDVIVMISFAQNLFRSNPLRLHNWIERYGPTTFPKICV